MPMLTAMDIGVRFSDEWVVLDRTWRVLDHGPALPPLRERHGASCRTYYFVPPSPLAAAIA